MIAPVLAVVFICHVSGIIDGDSFVCEGGQHVRLWGVDSPERYTPTGPPATRALAGLVAGRTLACEPKGRSYARVVALCTVNGRDVAGEMVRGGFAVDWPRYSHGRYAR